MATTSTTPPITSPAPATSPSPATSPAPTSSPTPTPNILNDIQSQNDSIETNITQLQEMQDDLQAQLDTGIANGSLNQDQINSLTEKITSISAIIVQLHQNSSNMFGFFQQNVASTAQSLADQKQAIHIVNNEIENTNKILQQKESETTGKQRLIEINDYYSEQYLDRTNLMKSIILVCIPLIILIVINNMGFLNSTLFNILLILIAVIGIIYLSKIVLKVISHNNMQYQNYDWNFNQTATLASTPINTSNPNGNPADSATVTTCNTSPLAATSASAGAPPMPF